MPNTDAFTQRKLPRACASGDLRVFTPNDLAAVRSWHDMTARVAPGFDADFLVLDLSYTTVPDWLFDAPVPIVAFAPDANLQWHWHRHALHRCDLVIADAPTCERLRHAGIEHARPACLFGAEAPFLAKPPDLDAPRDIDVLLVGNAHPAVQRRRLPWLASLARLAERHNVVVASGVFGDDYRALLRRSKVVFNRSVRGEANMRAFEAAASGCLLLQESGNQEIAAYLPPGEACVLYDTPDDLERLVERYLANEDERHAIVQNALSRVPALSADALWEQAVRSIEAELPALRERAANRSKPDPSTWLVARVWQALSSRQHDAALADDIAGALKSSPADAALHNALGVTTALRAGAGSGGDV